jgi:hypothetical protein
MSGAATRSCHPTAECSLKAAFFDDGALSGAIGVRIASSGCQRCQCRILVGLVDASGSLISGDAAGVAGRPILTIGFVVGSSLTSWSLNDRTGIVYSEIHDDEQAVDAIEFWNRANTWFNE